MDVQILLVLALVFAVFVAAFAVQNAQPIAVTFLTWELKTSVVVVVVGAAALGALSAGLLGMMRQVQLKLRVRGLSSQSRKLQEQVNSLSEDKQRLQEEIGRLDRELDGYQTRALPAPEEELWEDDPTSWE